MTISIRMPQVEFDKVEGYCMRIWDEYTLFILLHICISKTVYVHINCYIHIFILIHIQYIHKLIHISISFIRIQYVYIHNTSSYLYHTLIRS